MGVLSSQCTGGVTYSKKRIEGDAQRSYILIYPHLSSSILIVNIQMSDRANRVSSRDQDTTFFWKGSKPLFTCSSRIDKNQLGLAKNGKIEGADLFR